MELYQILIIVFAVVIAALYIIKRVVGADILQKIMIAKPVVGALVTALEALSKVWDNPTLKLVHVVLKAGAEAAEFAEQAWLMGQIEREMRNEYAKGLARNVLTKAGIEITDQVELIISGIIEAVCILLPHGVEPKVV